MFLMFELWVLELDVITKLQVGVFFYTTIKHVCENHTKPKRSSSFNSQFWEVSDYDHGNHWKQDRLVDS